MVSKIRDYEQSDLTEKHKVALRLADAFIFNFGTIPDDLARQAHQYFTDGELLDLLGKIFYSTSNKINVSLGLDEGDDVQAVKGIRVIEYPVAPNFVPSGLSASNPRLTVTYFTTGAVRIDARHGDFGELPSTIAIPVGAAVPLYTWAQLVVDLRQAGWVACLVTLDGPQQVYEFAPASAAGPPAPKP
jgi:hypothetical protein